MLLISCAYGYLPSLYPPIKTPIHPILFSNLIINFPFHFVETQACKVTMMAHSDLGGSLPPYVMNLITTEAPLKMMSAIRKITKRTESGSSVKM